MDRSDEAVWIDHYEALERPLYNVVYRWVWDPAESQDIVQEAFLRCWRIRDRVDPAGLKALLYPTALRLASNHRRRKKLWQMVGLGDEPAVEHEDAATGFAGRELRAALDRLPEPLRRVLLLSELAGMSYKEIADVMSIREGTVGSRRNRALATLRASLLERGIDRNEN